jgi:dephospho-CoA kinase
VVLIYVERKESEPQLQHRSEQEILKLKNNADYIVTNNKSLKCLYKQIDVILNDLELI